MRRRSVRRRSPQSRSVRGSSARGRIRDRRSNHDRRSGTTAHSNCPLADASATPAADTERRQQPNPQRSRSWTTRSRSWLYRSATSTPPGPAQRMQVVVSDIETARAELHDAGIDVRDIEDSPSGRSSTSATPMGQLGRPAVPDVRLTSDPTAPGGRRSALAKHVATRPSRLRKEVRR
jgi:hypothetical protein